MEKQYDNSPQAQFVKDVIRRERPELSEDQVELLWLEKLEAVKRELGEGSCGACGS